MPGPMEARRSQTLARRLRRQRAACPRIGDEIRAHQGWISFARYWELALFTPGLAITRAAPTVRQRCGGRRLRHCAGTTPLFGQALANQVAQVMAASPQVLEAGAGTGKLAADLLPALDNIGAAPERYAILELSGELRQRQRATLQTRAPGSRPGRMARCAARDLQRLRGGQRSARLPMPVHAVHWRDGIASSAASRWTLPGSWSGTNGRRPAPSAEAAAGLLVSAPYRGEIGLAARAWVAEWGASCGTAHCC